MSLCGGGGNGGGAHVVRMDPSRTGGGGGALERLQSSVAVCFKFGLGSLHRLDLVMNITGLYSGLVSKIFQKNGFPKTQAGRHDGSFLAVRTRDSNQGRPRTHTEPKISPGYHTLAASKCSQSSAAWYLPLQEHARGRKFIFISKKTLFQRNLAASCDGRALPIRTRDSNQGGPTWS